MVNNPPEDFSTADSAEKYLHQNQQNKENPSKEDLAKQLQERIYSSLTSDYAETVESEDAYQPVLAGGNFFKRIIAFQWDGRSRKDRPNENTHDLTPEEKSFQVMLVLEGCSMNSEKAANEDESKEIKPSWPDRLSIYMLDKNLQALYLYGLNIQSDEIYGWGPNISSVAFSDKNEGPETAGFGIQRGGQGLQSKNLGSPLTNLLTLNKILKNGRLDRPAMAKYTEYCIDRLEGKRISDLQLIKNSLPYMQAVTNSCLSALPKFILEAKD